MSARERKENHEKAIYKQKKRRRIVEKKLESRSRKKEETVPSPDNGRRSPAAVHGARQDNRSAILLFFS